MRRGGAKGRRRALLTLVLFSLSLMDLVGEGNGRSVAVVARFVSSRERRAGVRRCPVCVRAAASISRNPRGPLSGAPDGAVFVPSLHPVRPTVSGGAHVAQRCVPSPLRKPHTIARATVAGAMRDTGCFRRCHCLVAEAGGWSRCRRTA